MASRDIILLVNNIVVVGSTSDNASLKEENPKMRLHCYQASQRLSITTDQPPLPMAHTDPGIGPNISMCVQKYRCHVCIEKSKNYPTLLTKQTDNSQVDATSTSHVICPSIQWHKLFLITKVIDRQIHTKRQ